STITVPPRIIGTVKLPARRWIVRIRLPGHVRHALLQLPAYLALLEFLAQLLLLYLLLELPIWTRRDRRYPQRWRSFRNRRRRLALRGLLRRGQRNPQRQRQTEADQPADTCVETGALPCHGHASARSWGNRSAPF